MQLRFFRYTDLTRRRVIQLASGVVGSALLVALLAFSMPAIERQLDRWQLLPRHQDLTELSLADPHHLLKTYQPGNSQDISFVIVNRSGVPAGYHYTITENDARGQTVQELLSGTAEVASGDSLTLTKTLAPADLGSRVYIRITLSNGLETGYWLQRRLP